MQTFTDEITLPETKPETEWIAGRAVQKVMPTREHAILQKAFLYVLDAWANSDPKRAGDVLPEWRLRVSIPETQVHPLVPDVTYMSFKRLRPLSEKDRSAPSVPPEIVVEILSPSNKPADVETKRKEYLAWGISLVLIVDYETRSMDVYDATGYHGTIGNVEDYVPPMFPDLHLPLQRMFAKLDFPELDFDDDLT